MDVLIITVLISLLLVAGALVFLFLRAREGDFEHGDRLSLLPLEEDERGALSLKTQTDPNDPKQAEE